MTVVELVTGTRQRLHGVWQESLARTGHLLVANSVLTAGAGVLYWLLAARLYLPAVVGVNSAAISAMMLLAGAAQLNLMSALLRFLPTSGRAAGRMIRNAYLVGAGLSGVVAVGFLLGLRFWAPALTGLLGPIPNAAGFVVATMLWAMFVMQDNALVAGTYGSGTWITNDILPLGTTTTEIEREPTHLFKPAGAIRVRRNVNQDTPFPPEVPHALNPPPGCHFNPRCPHAMAVCRERYPEASLDTATHVVHCHLYPEGKG